MAGDPALQAALAGHWTFRRQVSTGARMTGVARFDPAGPDALRYREHGRAVLPDGQELSFFRGYLYRIGAGGLTILFDGPTQGLFQQVALDRAPAVWTGQGHHPCGQDIYRSQYRILSAPARGIEICHRVTGPKKDYVMETVYSPGAAA